MSKQNQFGNPDSVTINQKAPKPKQVTKLGGRFGKKTAIQSPVVKSINYASSKSKIK